MRAKAADSASGVGFLEFDMTGSGVTGPISLAATAVFSFSGDGTKVAQAMLLRSALDLQEYASVFKVAADLSCCA